MNAITEHIEYRLSVFFADNSSTGVSL